MTEKIDQLKEIIKEYLKESFVGNILICDRCGYMQGHQCVYCSKCGGNMVRHKKISRYDLFKVSRTSIEWGIYSIPNELYKSHSKLIDEIYSCGFFSGYEYKTLVKEIFGYTIVDVKFYGWINGDGEIQLTKTMIQRRNGLGDDFKKFQVAHTAPVSPNTEKVQSRPDTLTVGDIISVDDEMYKVFYFERFI